MIRRSLALLVTVAAATVAPPSLAHAQHAPESSVPPVGVIRVQVGGVNQSVPSMYDADGRRVEVTAPFAIPLDERLFADVAETAEAYRALLDPPVDGPGLDLGTLDLAGRADRREMPISLEVGLPAGFAAGARWGLVRRQPVFRRFRADAPGLGLNPDPTGNAVLLGQIGPEHEALGAATYLPLEETPAGQALQSRVEAETGERLALPETALTPDDVTALLTGDPFFLRDARAVRERFSPLDPELYLRWRVPGSVAQPTAEQGAWAAALEAGVRLPLEIEPETDLLIDLVPGGPRPALWLAGDGEVGLLSWVSLGVRTELRAPLRRTVTLRGEAGAPLHPFHPAGVTRDFEASPSTSFRVTASPRIHLHPAVSIGGVYSERFARDAETSESPFLHHPAHLHEGRRRDLGLSVEVRGTRAGLRFEAWPVDAGLTWYRAVAGRSALDHRTIEVWMRVQLRGWGGEG